MPELPEVETITRSLREGSPEVPSILGEQVSTVNLLWQRTLAAPSPAEFAARLPGQRIESIRRRAKFLVLRLSADHLLIHLRMSGDLRVEPETSAPLQPHDRLALDFASGRSLRFNDTRKFGRAWLTSSPADVLAGLGPEPLDPAFTPAVLAERLAGRRRLLKPLLLDQAFIAGLGNIYTDEALHTAGLHPLRLASSLTPAEIERLWAGIRAVLQEGIRRNGASIDWVYRGGDFQNHFRVYQRTGQPCPACGAPIQRILSGQRSTHFCPVCQR